MCESLDFFAYKDNTIVTYSNNQLIDEIKLYDITEDISNSIIIALPNYKYLLSYEDVDMYNKIAIGKLGEDKLDFHNITISLIAPPINDGVFVSNEYYYHIKEDNKSIHERMTTNSDLLANQNLVIESEYIGNYNELVIPANIKDPNDTKTNINNLLRVKWNRNTKLTDAIYNNKTYTIYNIYILAWFDNKYIVERDKENTIIYDITQPYDTKENILNNIKITAKVIKIIDSKELKISNLITNYTHVNADESIDIYYVSDTNITILHFTADREIEIIEYDILNIMKSNNVDLADNTITEITVDDYGFAFKLTNNNWYYINTDMTCFKYLGNFDLVAISHERAERNKEIHSSELEINKYLKNIVAEYD